MHIAEKVQLYQWSKPPWLRLDILDNLKKWEDEVIDIIKSSATDLTIYMLRSPPLCSEVIKHKVHLDIKTIEAIINI